jgi:hypothetical protein
MMDITKHNMLPSVGAIIGVTIGVMSKSGMFGTLMLGILFSATGYFIQNKIN